MCSSFVSSRYAPSVSLIYFQAFMLDYPCVSSLKTVILLCHASCILPASTLCDRGAGRNSKWRPIFLFCFLFSCLFPIDMEVAACHSVLRVRWPLISQVRRLIISQVQWPLRSQVCRLILSQVCQPFCKPAGYG